MMGCRYGAKNTLDLNYLYLAEKHGAQSFPKQKWSMSSHWRARAMAAAGTKSAR